MLLAGACVALLIYFIHHVASRINVDTVIDLVHDDVLDGISRLTLDEAAAPSQADISWEEAVEVCLHQSGYLQQIDIDALVDWADDNDCVMLFYTRPGDFIFPHAPFARVSKPIDGAEAALRNGVALSRQGGSPADLTFPIAQLVEVAVRALSPGINDPQTAISVLNRLGATLTSLSRRRLDSGVHEKCGVVRLMIPPLRYEDLARVMFELIRESAGRSPSVLIHLVAVLAQVARVEDAPRRVDVLKRHAQAAEAEGRARFVTEVDKRRLADAHANFLAVAAKSARGSAPS